MKECDEWQVRRNFWPSREEIMREDGKMPMMARFKMLEENRGFWLEKWKDIEEAIGFTNWWNCLPWYKKIHFRLQNWAKQLCQ